MKTPGTKRERGFTIVELILIIAVLAVVALLVMPKFISVTQSAEDSAVKAIGGNLESSINILHSRYILTRQAYEAQDIVNNIDVKGVQITVENL